jgi:hypothetical protein
MSQKIIYTPAFKKWFGDWVTFTFILDVNELRITAFRSYVLFTEDNTPILAMLILGSTFIFWYIIIFKDIEKEKEVLISGIIGSLTTVSMGVVGYYFGSSIGSANKQSQIDKYINK